MKLKKPNTPFSKIYYILGVLGLILLISLKFVFGSDLDKPNALTANSLDEITYLPKAYNITEVIRQDINKIHSTPNLSVYLNQHLGVPYMIYAYKDELAGRNKTDNFFLHVYLKDSDELFAHRKIRFAIFDFQPLNPIELEIDGTTYFVFKRGMRNEFVSLDNIDYINTGRFDIETKNRSLDLKKIKLDDLDPANVRSNLDRLTIEISEKGYEKIKAKRDTALSNNILVTGDNDLVKAQITFKDSKKEKADVRLKGDWIDHLVHPFKWSFRIIMDGEETVDGMRKFSVQHPKSRRYMWEWMFNKLVKENDIIGLRYDFVETDLQITNNGQVTKTIPIGIMAKEESFDKLLIESNRRREGLILAFDESLIWGDREKQFHMGLEPEAASPKITSISNSPIRVFNENKVLTDPVLSKQFAIAKDLLEGVRNKELKVSEAFDIDKLTTFVALSNLFGAAHGLADHNLRIYFNPITSKLEPISFDSNSGVKLTEIVHYPFAEGDTLYTEKLLEKLEKISDPLFINDFIERHYDDIKGLFTSLKTEYGLAFDLSIFEYNSNFIKKNINPSSAIVANLLEHDRGKMKLEVKNVADFPVVINDLKHQDGKKLNKQQLQITIAPNMSKTIVFDLDESFINAFVSKKNKVGEFRYPKDIGKLRITHELAGISLERSEKISPFGKNPNRNQNISEYKELFAANLSEHNFIELLENEKIIIVKTGVHEIGGNIIFPSGYRVIFEKGTQLDLKNGASIISFSSVEWVGTKTEPIRFYSSDISGGGIFVSDTNEESVVDYCKFSGLSNPTSSLWNLSGAVNFHEANVAIQNSVFEKNRCEDGLNIIRSDFSIKTSIFRDTQSDAFDGDFVKGSITDCRFINTGNDGIDVSGSTLSLEGITIQNPSDKAISAGEASTISGSNVDVEGGEIGVVSKDLSSVLLSNVTITDTRLAFSSFQKKSEFGAGIIRISNLSLTNNELDHLIENGSMLYIDNQLVETVSNSVIDQMYGKEYGKSSK